MCCVIETYSRTSLIAFAWGAKHFPRTTLDSWPTTLKSLEVKRIRVPRYAKDLRTIKFLTVKPLVGLIASADQLKSSWPVAGIAEWTAPCRHDCLSSTCTRHASTLPALGMGSSTIRTRKSESNSISVFCFIFQILLFTEYTWKMYSFCYESNVSFYISA